MKVITDKKHRIYFNDKEVKKIRYLAKKSHISIAELCRQLGITQMSLWRKFARKTPFFYLEVVKLDYLGILWVEKHEQYIRLKESV